MICEAPAVESISRIGELVRVLPILQSNIRRFIAVRKYESLKRQREDIKRLERKLKNEKQRNRMIALSNPSARHKPNPPRDSKEKKTATHSSPAMSSRLKVPHSQKLIISAVACEDMHKDSLSPAAAEEEKAPLAGNILPVQKWDQNITTLMKNINDITMTLNMHDSSIIPHNVNNVRIHGNSYYHEEKIGYFDFSAAGTSPPKVSFGNNTIIAEHNATQNAANVHRSPDGKSLTGAVGGFPTVVHSDQITAVLAGIEAEYAVLAHTNEQIKAAMARSNIPTMVGESTVPSVAPTVASSERVSTHHSPYHSPARRLPSESLSLYTVSAMDSDDEGSIRSATTRLKESHNSSSRSNLSEAYVPIRRSGDVKLDMMVQETLIRANNSILDSTIEEDKAYDGDELNQVMHKVAIQINDTYQAIEGTSEDARKLSTSTVDSVGLDALTRSITAIQMGGTFASKNRADGDQEEETPASSQYTSAHPSVENSANNSMDSNISGDSGTSDLTHVSELTLAIQDILANLSGGLFDRARLQLSGPEIPEESPTVTKAIQRNNSTLGDKSTNKSRAELLSLQRSNSQLQPLEMADYLNSVNNNNTGGNSDTHQLHHVDGTPVVQSAQEQEVQDLKVLLEHQEKSMQLIRDSIRAIEAQASGRGIVAVSSNMSPNRTGPTENDAHHKNTESYADHDDDNNNTASAGMEAAPKPKARKKKKVVRKDSAEEKQAPSAQELDMLRNLGGYLQRQKQALRENKGLSYDQLMLKAQSNLGLHQKYQERQSQAALREEQLQRQVRQELLYDRFLYSQQKQEEDERRAARAAKKEQASVHARVKHAAAIMYPKIYDSDNEGTATDSNAEHDIPEEEHYASSSYSYGHHPPHLAHQYQTKNKKYAKEEYVEAPIRPHKERRRDSLDPDDRQASSYRSPLAYDQRGNNSDSHHSSYASNVNDLKAPLPRPSPPKEPFNMSEALLQAPVMTFSDNGRSVGSKSKSSTQAKHKPNGSSRLSQGNRHNDHQDSLETKKHGHNNNLKEGYENKTGILRESTEDLYQTKRHFGLKDKEDEMHEYRNSYQIAAGAIDEEEEDEEVHTDVSSHHAAPRRPAQQKQPSPAQFRQYLGQNPSRQNQTPSHQHQPHHSGSLSHSNGDESHSVGGTAKKKKTTTSAAGVNSHTIGTQSGSFDKGLLTSIEHLNLKPPRSIRSSASVEKSPRSQVARLLHPFK